MTKINRTALFAILLVILCTSCSTFIHRKPWRNYDKIPFDSKKWNEGDELERGRMRSDMMDQIEGKSREEVLELLGEPDEKMTEEGTEYWLYNTEHPGLRTYLQTPVTFDSKGRASIGMLEDK